MFINTWAHVFSWNASGSVESGTVAALAAVVSLDAVSFGAYVVADMSSAEGEWVTVGFWMFEVWIAAFLNWCLGVWAVLADLWIFIDSVGAIFVTVAVDLVIQ